MLPAQRTDPKRRAMKEAMASVVSAWRLGVRPLEAAAARSLMLALPSTLLVLATGSAELAGDLVGSDERHRCKGRLTLLPCTASARQVRGSLQRSLAASASRAQPRSARLARLSKRYMTMDSLWMWAPASSIWRGTREIDGHYLRVCALHLFYAFFVEASLLSLQTCTTQPLKHSRSSLTSRQAPSLKRAAIALFKPPEGVLASIDLIGHRMVLLHGSAWTRKAALQEGPHRRVHVAPHRVHLASCCAALLTSQPESSSRHPYNRL